MSGPPLLELAGITKSYGPLRANDGVDLVVRAGEIQALLGENGAGKSTLVKAIFGIVQPDAGAIRWQGRPVTIGSPHVARALGIGMVFQHFSLFDALSVVENVALGLESARPGATLAHRVREVSRAYGLPLEPDRPVHTLSVGERQRIEIVRCLLQEPKLLIMDEPTSVLTPQEVARLFETLRLLQSQGCAILYISHKLEEVRELCARATVLRGGRVVGSLVPRGHTARALAGLMIGTEVRLVKRGTGPPASARPRLEVRQLSLPPPGPHDLPLSDIVLAVAPGEIVGIAGVAGNGQRELLEALAGERPAPAQAILLDGRPVGALGPARRRELGLCYVPEERNGTGAVGSFTLTDNAILGAWRRGHLTRAGFVRRSAARDLTARVIAENDVRTGGTEARASSLSGGNLQKFIVGREVLQAPTLLIAAQPTWGVDAGAAARIHEALIGLAAAGAAVLLVSQDLDEILAICDRLAVINGGRLSRAVTTAGADIQAIGLMMGGVHESSADPHPSAAAAA